MFELAVEGVQGVGTPLGVRPILIGRAATNEIVLDDDAVSGRHAAVWTDGLVVYVQDLASRNGVQLNGAAVSCLARASAGDRMVVGRTSLVIRGVASRSEKAAAQLVLEELSSGHATAFDGDRLRIGDGPDVQLRVQGVAEVVLIRVAEDEVAMGIDDDMVPLRVGEPFEVGGRSFVLRPVEGHPQETRDLGVVRAGYLLEATLEGGPGPRAWITSPASGIQHAVVAENRATLLWILARRWLEEKEAGGAEESVGWVSEPDVLTSVWGRAEGGTSTNLRVLVCRIRKDLRAAGLDPWFLEHRAGHLRARVGEVRMR